MKHPEAAAEFVANASRRTWHDQALWGVREKRDSLVSEIPEWEELRSQGAQIKAWALDHLEELLDEFEANCKANGVHVHRAADSAEHNRIVHGILSKHGATRIVKSKSMLTEECGLNEALHEEGIEVIDTDLGERIVQLRGEPPSHIVMPAIHLQKHEIGQTFHETMGTPEGMDDELELTRAARRDLRERFLAAEAGITGVNFAVAETGNVVVCTNEGNADLGANIPDLHIACMGLEKVIPKLEHLGVFTRLLARSATGQPITVYTSHFRKPRPGREMHVVIVDNGRRALLKREKFRSALSCIRCGACMNTCPIYRRSGGHSYKTTIPGPIGSILAPSKDPATHDSLPFASTLCGSCTDVCPVKIPLHRQLLDLRAELMEAGHGKPAKARNMKLGAKVLASPGLYRLAGTFGRLAVRGPRFLLPREMKNWLRDRDLPAFPAQTFRQRYTGKAEEKDEGGRMKAEEKGEIEKPEAPSLELADIAIRYDDPVAKFADLQRANGSIVHEVDDAPAEYEDILLLAGEIGVAENGAIWVSFDGDADRPGPFLAETIGIVISRQQIVSNMMQAYCAIDTLPDYGVFIAGPSKTADIAQCLVIGAHGPIGMHVFLTK
ncbi:MAG: L-lactate dehydrogenase complex protein LldF [Rhodothermales bacterium]|jgi:L-lactate dehydrogenase complex protein LldF